MVKLDLKTCQRYIMSRNHLPQQQLPKELLKRSKQVFSKYPIVDLREASDNYMRIYQLLHARELPKAILVKTKPFESTQVMVDLNDTENLIFLRGKQTSEQSILEKNKQRKEEKIDKVQDNEQDKTSTKINNHLNDNIRIYYDQQLAVCNLLRKAPASYAVAKRIYSEIFKRFPNYRPKTHLDYGSGLGPWSWAADEIFQCDSHISIEPNPYMRKLSKFLKSEETKYQQLETLSHTVQLSYDQFDLVTIAYVLEEINNPETRQIVLESLWQKVKPGGVMILCCPGSPMGFRFVHDFRKMMLKTGEAQIIAPCPHQGKCPLAAEGVSWCHFSQAVSTWPKDVFPKNVYQSSIQDEKFSYLAIRKQKEKEQIETSVEKPLHEQSSSWARILFPILKRGRHQIVDLCTKEEKIERRVIAKSHGEEGGYQDLKKLKWGDLWRFTKWIPNRLRKADGTKGKRLW